MSYQRDFVRRLKVAMIGVGSHAYRNVLPCLHYLPVELVALCDVNRAALDKTAPEYGVSRLYASSAELYRNEQLDAVFIAVGPRHHPALMIEALDAGVAVWTEKPAAERTADLEAVLPHRNNLPVVVGFKKAFMPATRKGCELPAMPESGKLRSILAEYPIQVPADGHAVLANRTFTNWLGNGCHPLSAMLALAGPAAAVTTLRAPNGGGACLIEFASGAFGNLHFSWGMRGPNERYTALAEHVEVIIENSRRVTLHRGIPFDYARTTSFAPPGLDSGSIVWEPANTLGTLENKALFTQGFYGSMAALCAAVLDGTPPVTGTLEFAIDVQRVYEAALVSQGDRVALPAT